MLDAGRRLGTQHEFSISLQTTQPLLLHSLLLRGTTPSQAPKQGTGPIPSPPLSPAALQPELSPSACDRGAAPASLPPLSFLLVLPPPADETSLNWRFDHFPLLQTILLLPGKPESQELDFKGFRDSLTKAFSVTFFGNWDRDRLGILLPPNQGLDK